MNIKSKFICMALTLSLAIGMSAPAFAATHGDVLNQDVAHVVLTDPQPRDSTTLLLSYKFGPLGDNEYFWTANYGFMGSDVKHNLIAYDTNMTVSGGYSDTTKVGIGIWKSYSGFEYTSYKMCPLVGYTYNTKAEFNNTYTYFGAVSNRTGGDLSGTVKWRSVDKLA